jgi:enhancing lycopene biosynthesis protein 2
MATRVGVVLSGCGARDGSEINEAVLALYWIERFGGQAICMAPDVTAAVVVDHLTQLPDGTSAPRRVLSEAARIARGKIHDIASVRDNDLDALVFPGGHGVANVLSNYAEKGVVCDVHPEVARLLKAMLSRHRPMGFICLAPILAARVLGPAAGVRITLGSKACPEAKHAAVMGADVRPCPEREILVDQKNRVVSTPAYMYDDARLADVGSAIERLVRQVLTFARERTQQRQPQPQPQPGQPQGKGQAQGRGQGQGQGQGRGQGQQPRRGNDGNRGNRDAKLSATAPDAGVVVRRQGNRDGGRPTSRPGDGSS